MTLCKFKRLPEDDFLSILASGNSPFNSLVFKQALRRAIESGTDINNIVKIEAEAKDARRQASLSARIAAKQACKAEQAEKELESLGINLPNKNSKKIVAI